MLTAVLALMMLAVSLGLKSTDFDFIKNNPSSILIGSIAQLLCLPILTLLLVMLVSPAPGIALGMLIVACCPGGNVSNLLTRISGSDAAYSVALTTVSSIFAALFLPFAILFWTDLYAPTADLLDQINIDRADFIQKTTITLVIPLTIGLTTAYKWPAIAGKITKYLIPTSVVLLFGLIIAGVSSNFDLLIATGASIMPLVILHNGSAFGLGFLVGHFTLRGKPKIRALTFEVGIQNTGLGLLIVLSQLGGISDAAVIIGLWSIWHIFAGLLLASGFRYLDKQNH